MPLRHQTSGHEERLLRALQVFEIVRRPETTMHEVVTTVPWSGSVRRYGPAVRIGMHGP
jgi:hypothetical protein